MAWAVKVLGDIQDGVERKWDEPGWLVWGRPGEPDARWRTVAWSPKEADAQRFESEGQAIAVAVALMPAQYLCEVVACRCGADDERAE